MIWLGLFPSADDDRCSVPSCGAPGPLLGAVLARGHLLTVPVCREHGAVMTEWMDRPDKQGPGHHHPTALPEPMHKLRGRVAYSNPR